MLCSPKAQLIRVDPSSGSLTWDETVGRDTFDDEVCKGQTSTAAASAIEQLVWLTCMSWHMRPHSMVTTHQ
jgi:hypothetical protein